MDKYDDKFINDLISAALWDKGYAGGYGYYCTLNNKYVGNISVLRKLAELGDAVEIEPYTIRGGWYCNPVRFTLYWDDDAKDLVRYYRKHGKPRRNSTRPRDYQKSKVYNWEYGNLSKGKQLSPSAIDWLIADVFDTYGMSGQEPTVVITARKKRYSTYYPFSHTIKLAAGWGQGQRVVLHETTHALIELMGLKVPSHGKEFVALVMEIYDLFLDIDVGELRNARECGERLGTSHTIAPPGE